MSNLPTGIMEPQGGFEPTNLPITNRLRCHCATGAEERNEPRGLVFDSNRGLHGICAIWVIDERMTFHVRC